MKRRETPVGKDKEKAASSSPASSPRSPANGRKKTSQRENSTSTEDTFEARRSTRVSATKYSHDGDSWQETLAVCEMPATKNGVVTMKIRSYYSNQRTGDRVWDEPPSGASKILPATEEMRKMAEAQLEEMQITFGSALNESTPEKKRGFFRRSKQSPQKETTSPRYKLKYKPGSFLSQVKKKTPTKQKQQDDSLDPEVQKAIALSMNDTTAESPTKEPVIRSEVSFQDDELAMVMALSLSEQQAMSEEEMFQRALVESRRSTSTPSVAALPVKDEFSGLGLSQSTSSEETRRKQRSDEKVITARTYSSDDPSLDKKMPAKPTKATTARENNDQKETAKPTKSATRDNSPRKEAAKPTKSTTRERSIKQEEAVSRDSKPRSSQSSASGSSRSSVNGGKSVLSDRKLKERKPSQDSSDSKLPTKPSQSAAIKYGTSVRPASNKKLAITRSSSGGSRNSLNAEREQERKSSPQKPDLSEETAPTELLPWGVHMQAEPKATTVNEYSTSRATGRSLFGASSKQSGKSVSTTKETNGSREKNDLNGVERNSSGCRRSTRTGAKQAKAGKL